MPTGTDWYDHFRRFPASKIKSMRNALKVLLADSMFNEHYGELHRMDYFLEKIQIERKKK